MHKKKSFPISVKLKTTNLFVNVEADCSFLKIILSPEIGAINLMVHFNVPKNSQYEKINLLYVHSDVIPFIFHLMSFVFYYF